MCVRSLSVLTYIYFVINIYFFRSSSFCQVFLNIDFSWFFFSFLSLMSSIRYIPIVPYLFLVYSIFVFMCAHSFGTNFLYTTRYYESNIDGIHLILKSGQFPKKMTLVISPYYTNYATVTTKQTLRKTIDDTYFWYP